MQDFQKLYMLAHSLGSNDVCDMVIDRWHEQLHRHTPRICPDAVGLNIEFDFLKFDPFFLNHLPKHDVMGFGFLLDLLVALGERAWEWMSEHTSRTWSKDIKLALIRRLQCPQISPVQEKDLRAVCKAYHHHHGFGLDPTATS